MRRGKIEGITVGEWEGKEYLDVTLAGAGEVRFWKYNIQGEENEGYDDIASAQPGTPVVYETYRRKNGKLGLSSMGLDRGGTTAPAQTAPERAAPATRTNGRAAPTPSERESIERQTILKAAIEYAVAKGADAPEDAARWAWNVWRELERLQSAAKVAHSEAVPAQ